MRGRGRLCAFRAWIPWMILVALSVACCGCRHVGQMAAKEIRVQNRIFEVCQGAPMGHTEDRPRRLVGADEAAVRRVVAGWTGKGDFEPPVETERQLQIAQEVLDGPPEWAELAAAVRRLRARVAPIVTNWRSTESLFKEVGESLRNDRLLVSMRDCALDDLRRMPGSERDRCAVVAKATTAWFRSNLSRLRQARTRVADDVLALGRETRRLADAMQNTPSASGSSDTDSSLALHQTSLALRMATALGGLLQDEADALHHLELAGSAEEEAALRHVGDVVLGAQSDRIADLLLLAMARVVEQLDRALEQFDVPFAGMLAREILVDSGLIEEVACQVGRETKAALDAWRMDPASLGARVCAAATSSHSDFPNSRMMTRVFLGLLGASSAYGEPEYACADLEMGGGSSVPAATASRPREVAQVAAVGASWKALLPRTSGRETPPVEHGLARATWNSRIQLADRAWSRASHPQSVRDRDFPVLADIPVALGASYLMVELQQGPTLDSYRNEPGIRFDLARDMVLASSFAKRSDVYGVMCAEQLRSEQQASLLFRRSGAGVACLGVVPSHVSPGRPVDLDPVRVGLAQIAWEICRNNARLDRIARVDSLCGKVSSLSSEPKKGKGGEASSPVQCRREGFAAVVTADDVRYSSAEFSSTERSDRSRPGLLTLATGMALAYRAEEGAPAHSDRGWGLRFVGRASKESFKNGSGVDFVLHAAVAEQASGYDGGGSGPSWRWIKDSMARACAAPLCTSVLERINGAKALRVDERYEERQLDEFWPLQGGAGPVGPTIRASLQSDRDKVWGTIANVLAPGHAAPLPARGWVRGILSQSDRDMDGAANDILSVLRAMGAAGVILRRDPLLCSGGTCLVEGLGNQGADPLAHDIWRSFSVTIGSEAAPDCERLVDPSLLR